jgi:ankyrin repeat protein
MSTSVRSFDQIAIAAPCDANWESMIGNDQVRFCEHCHLHVNNLSTMTRSQAMQFVARSRGRICIRLVQSPSGGPLAARMPEQLYRIGRRTSRLAAGAFTAALSITSAAAQSCPSIADASSCPTHQKQNLKDVQTNPLIDEFTGIVAGTVTNHDSGPLSDVTVVLVDRESGEEHYTTTTASGEYSFQGLAGGDYVIWARKPRFQTDRDKAKVSPNSRVRVDFEMRPANVIMLGGAMGSVTVSENPLAKAVSENDLATVKALAFNTRNINAIETPGGMGLLAEAVDHGNREIVEVLLLAGANVNARTEGGRTPLMAVSEKTTVELVRDLLAYGANINARDDFGDDAVIIAAEASNVGVLKELISAGARVDATNSVGHNALFGAARNNVEAVDLLIKSGANLNARDEDGQTVLMAMAPYGELATFQALISKGAALDVTDYEGRTVLMSAVANEDSAIAEFLIRMGADIEAQASDGTTALMVAAQGDRTKTLSLLIAAGSKVNATDAEGLTVLLRASWNASDEVVQALLNAGADVTVKDHEGRTPLAIARERGNDSVAGMLKSRGARE